MDDNCGEWVECMGVASGCGCKEVYRFPHITYPYSFVSVLFCSSIPIFCSLKKQTIYIMYLPTVKHMRSLLVYLPTVKRMRSLLVYLPTVKHMGSLLVYLPTVKHMRSLLVYLPTVKHMRSLYCETHEVSLL